MTLTVYDKNNDNTIQYPEDTTGTDLSLDTIDDINNRVLEEHGGNLYQQEDEDKKAAANVLASLEQNTEQNIEKEGGKEDSNEEKGETTTNNTEDSEKEDKDNDSGEGGDDREEESDSNDESDDKKDTLVANITNPTLNPDSFIYEIRRNDDVVGFTKNVDQADKIMCNLARKSKLNNSSLYIPNIIRESTNRLVLYGTYRVFLFFRQSILDEFSYHKVYEIAE